MRRRNRESGSDFVMRITLSAIGSIAAQPLARFIAGFFCVLLAMFFLFRQLGSWLIAGDTPPEHLDVICTFAGENRRVVYSKELALRYRNAHWVLSDYKDGHGRLLQKNNFDMRRVTIIDTCKSTISEMHALGEWLDRYRPRPSGPAARIQVGLVSSPYHMRRIRIMAARRLSRPDVRWYLLPVPLEKYRWNRDTFRYWWRSNAAASITILELLKIGYFMVTGYW
ncbi:MAG: YdcF family protein [Chitinispirillaceae bacterium]|nr:YdcF family protein [Chitinispirillaceae bacterium]